VTTTVLFLIAVTCSLVAFYYQLQVRVIDELSRSAVLVNEIPGMGESLRKSRREGSFAAFLCASPDQPGPDDVIEAQISLEHGKLGFDWVLLASETSRNASASRSSPGRGAFS
jgi:hypothetical protein